MFTTRLLRSLFIASLLSMGCGDSGATGGDFPPEDGSTDADPGDGGAPTFDVPPLDTGTVEIDTGTRPVDTGVRPVDTGMTSVDTGVRDTGGGGGMCPSSCATASQCSPCRDPSDPPGSMYCCISGLCLYMSGSCPSGTPDSGGGGGTGDGGGGGGSDGGDGGGGGGGGSDGGDGGGGGAG